MNSKVCSLHFNLNRWNDFWHKDEIDFWYGIEDPGDLWDIEGGGGAKLSVE